LSLYKDVENINKYLESGTLEEYCSEHGIEYKPFVRMLCRHGYTITLIVEADKYVQKDWAQQYDRGRRDLLSRGTVRWDNAYWCTVETKTLTDGTHIEGCCGAATDGHIRHTKTRTWIKEGAIRTPMGKAADAISSQDTEALVDLL